MGGKNSAVISPSTFAARGLSIMPLPRATRAIGKGGGEAGNYCLLITVH